MTFNQNGSINTLDGTSLSNVESFTYLGSDISSTEKDISTRIAKAWSALDKLRTVWKSSLPVKIKKNFFRAIVESILLYGSSAWTLRGLRISWTGLTLECYVPYKINPGSSTPQEKSYMAAYQMLPQSLGREGQDTLDTVTVARTKL
jgi:hypothetical protein